MAAFSKEVPYHKGVLCGGRTGEPSPGGQGVSPPAHTKVCTREFERAIRKMDESQVYAQAPLGRVPKTSIRKHGHRQFVGQPIGIHGCAVMAPAGIAIDEQIHGSRGADMVQGDGSIVCRL
jgi:hypothetical protein